MDLTEGKKSWNVWKLESEAFKKPIEIKIWYDNKELAEFNRKFDNLEWVLASHRGVMNTHLDKINGLEKSLYKLDKWLDAHEKASEELYDVVLRQWNEIKELYKEIATLKTKAELHEGTILHMQEQMRLLEKKATKQPMVFHDKWFISWRESSGLWMINVPDGDYLLIAKYVVWEHNEFVTNQNELLMDTIHVEGQHYIPFYKLEWGTELDTPTATIYYDLVFIPM